MLIVSWVLKTRDSIETRAFKTRFTWFASSLMWKIFVSWRFQTPTTHTVSLSLSNTLSVSQALSLSLSYTLKVQTPKSLKRSLSNAHRPRCATKLSSSSNTPPFPQTTFQRSPHPSLEITQMLAVKRSPSSACNKITVTVKRYPLSSDHILTIPSSIPRKSLLSLPTEVQILLCLKVWFS